MSGSYAAVQVRCRGDELSHALLLDEQWSEERLEFGASIGGRKFFHMAGERPEADLIVCVNLADPNQFAGSLIQARFAEGAEVAVNTVVIHDGRWCGPAIQP